MNENEKPQKYNIFSGITTENAKSEREKGGREKEGEEEEERKEKMKTKSMSRLFGQHM